MFADIGVLDLLVIFCFLASCVVIGFKTRGKVKDFVGYASGRRQHLSNAVIIATLTASLCSVSLFWNGVEQVYKQGLFYIIFLLVADIVGILFMIYYFSPKMFKITTITLQEYFGMLYGRYLRAFLSFTEVVRYVVLFAMQLKLIGGCIEVCFNCSKEFQTVFIIISAFVLMLYSAYGGLKAVSVTDVCQFFFFIFLIPIIALYLWGVIGAEGHYRFFKLFDGSVERMTIKGTFTSVDAYIAIFAVIIRAIVGIPVSTFYFQRVSMCKDSTSVKHNLGAAVSIRVVIDIFVLFIGLQLLAVSSGLINDKTPVKGDVIKYMISFFNFPLIKTFFFISILSLSISTADTNFNCVSVLFGNDILPLAGINKNKNISIFCGVIMCTLGLIFALSINSLFHILMIGTNFFLPISTMPLLLTIIKFKTHRNAMIVGIICGIVVTALYPFILPAKSPYKMYAFGPGIMANLYGILITHFFYKRFRGWKSEYCDMIEKTNSENEINRDINDARAKLIAQMRSLAALTSKYNLHDMDDNKILLNFYALDFVVQLHEYQEYKSLVFKNKLKMDFIPNDRASDFNEEFKKQLVTVYPTNLVY